MSTNNTDQYIAGKVRNISKVSQQAESERYENKHFFSWIINDFSCKNAKRGENLPSIKFEFSLGRDMLFEGYLTITGEVCDDRKCRLELKNTSNKYWKVCCEVKFNVGAVYSTHFTQERTLHEFSLYTPNKYCIFNEGRNVVECEIVHISYKQVEEPPPLIKVEKSSLQTDMEKLFESQIMSDITFDVVGEEILAHKLILASRSKFFADMFKLRDMEEIVAAKITINDTEPKVFNEMLRYIYTDKAPCLNEMPKKLLIASQKYCLTSLKLMCEYELVPKINFENASELLILASDNNAKHLKDHAATFIKKHCKAVADTPGWQIIIHHKLHLLPELYSAVIE